MRGRVLRRAATLVALAMAAGCATQGQQSSPAPFAPVAAAGALAGPWDTAAQFAGAPEALKVAPQAGSRAPWLDRQHGLFVPFAAPALEAAWPRSRAVYLIWRRGGPDGPVSRQRIWQFGPDDAGGVQMRFFTLPRAPETGFSPVALAALTPADLSGYPATCHLPVTPAAQGWQAAIPDSCWINAASGRRMRLEAVIAVSGPRLSYREAGVLESGAPAFVVPGTGDYLFDRTAR